MVAPLFRSVLVIENIQGFYRLLIIEDRSIVPVLLGLPGDDVSAFPNQRIELLVHMRGILLKREYIWHIVLHQTGELRCPLEITRILAYLLQSRRNSVLAVVPDIVIENTEVMPPEILISPLLAAISVFSFMKLDAIVNVMMDCSPWPVVASGVIQSGVLLFL